MAAIKRTQYRIIDQAFGVGSGYVLDFSNRTLSEWFEDELGIDIYADRYAGRGESKANHIRAFVEAEPAPLVSRMLRALNRTAINTYDEYGIPKNSVNSYREPYGRFAYTGQAWIPELGMAEFYATVTEQADYPVTRPTRRRESAALADGA